MASGNPSIDYSMPCLASFFDAMSGVKKLTNFMPAITCPTPAYEASFVLTSRDTSGLDRSALSWGGGLGDQLPRYMEHLGTLVHPAFENLQAEVGQVIAGIKFVSFLTD